MTDVLLDPVSAPCADHLSRVDSPYLDCVSDTLALLLAHRGVRDVRTPFACDWRFDMVDNATGPAGPDLPPARQDDLLAARTGWRPRWSPVAGLDDDLPRWWARLREGEPVVVVGDAYELPWLPYAGHEHMEHGFILDGLVPAADGRSMCAHVVDPYDNATEWGHATPLTTEVPVPSLATALAGGRWAVLEQAGAPDPPDSATVLADNAAAILDAARTGAYRRFVEQYRPMGTGELTHLALQTWLLTRQRGLHARWLRDLPGTVLGPGMATRFADEVEAGWRRAGEVVYLALRRVASGRAAPTGALTAVQAAGESEARFAADLLAGLTEKGNARC